MSPSGTKVTGGPAQAQAAPLGTGLYQDVIQPVRASAGTRSTCRPGARLVTSVTEIASFKAQGTAEFHARLLDPQGNEVDFQSEAIEGRDAVDGRARTFSPRTGRAGGRPTPAGRYVLEAEIAKGGNTIDPLDIPLEIGVQLLKPGEDPGLVRANGGAPLPAPTPTPTPKPARHGGAAPAATAGSGASAPRRWSSAWAWRACCWGWRPRRAGARRPA